MNTLEIRALGSLEQRAKCRIEDRRSTTKGVWIDATADQFSSLGLIGSHELFEGLLLVDLGFTLGAISYELIDNLNSRVYEQFFASLLPSRGRPVQRSKEYVEHSGESKEILRSFPRFVETLEKGMRGEEFSTQTIRLRKSSSLGPSYNKILLLYLGMIQTPAIRAYLDAVKFSSTGAWAQLLSSVPEPGEVVQAEDREEQSAASVLAGFLRLVGYHAEIKATLDNLDKVSDYADAARFSERIRDVFNWRIDFVSQEAVRRFDQVRKLVIESSVAELPVGVRVRVRNALEETLDEVFGFEQA